MLARQHRESYQSRTLSSDLPAGQLGASAGREPLPSPATGAAGAVYFRNGARARARGGGGIAHLPQKRIRETKIEKDPIFILGHWRSGTTYLQNVLARRAVRLVRSREHDRPALLSLLGRLIQPPIERASGTAARRITCSTRSISRWRRRSAC